VDTRGHWGYLEPDKKEDKAVGGNGMEESEEGMSI